MAYLVSSSAIVILFMLYKKNDQKVNLWRALAMSIVAYECYLCMIAGIMTVVHIPVDAYTVSMVNLIMLIIFVGGIVRNKEIQRYYIPICDTVFIIFLVILCGYIFLTRFTPELKIVFETSDPGVHLKMAMNFVNKKAVDGMYIGQLINGLFIESLLEKFQGAFIYKSFILQYGINFFVAAYIFWAVLQKYIKCLTMRVIGYIVTIVYILGYPLNDLLYGFVYLQMSITIIIYLICLMQDYFEGKEKDWLYGSLIGMGCLGVSIGYTLFAPPVYIAVLGGIAYKTYQDRFRNDTIGIGWKKTFVLRSIYIFLMPTFLTVWLVLIIYKINNISTGYGAALTSAEGAIYRNLYSDFLLYFIPATYGFVMMLKKRKIDLLSFLIPVFGVYYFVFLYLMLHAQISTYYFYKFNYVVWMFVLILFVIGMQFFWEKERILFGIVLIGGIGISIIYFSGIEKKYSKENILYMPFCDADSFFRVNSFNKVLMSNASQMSEGLVDICNIVNNLENTTETVFVGYWQDLYWYEALSNQRFDGFNLLTSEIIIEQFMTGKHGEYMVVQKGTEGVEDYLSYIENGLVYENDYAWLVKKSGAIE